MNEKKKWMIASKGRRHILLHLNEELKQYKKLKRVPNWVIRLVRGD